MWRVRVTIVAVQKQYVLHTPDSMSVALVIQHTMCISHIILSVASLDLTYFSTLFHKIYRILKMLLSIHCVFRFSLQLCLKYFSF